MMPLSAIEGGLRPASKSGATGGALMSVAERMISSAALIELSMARSC